MLWAQFALEVGDRPRRSLEKPDLIVGDLEEFQVFGGPLKLWSTFGAPCVD